MPTIPPSKAKVADNELVRLANRKPTVTGANPVGPDKAANKRAGKGAVGYVNRSPANALTGKPLPKPSSTKRK